MTLLKEESVPISPEEIQRIRTQLTHPHDYQVLDREGRRYLFIRTAGAEPDPVADLEAGLEGAPSWVGNNLAAVLLLSDKAGLHIPAYSVLPLLEARQRIDEQVAKDARAHLDVHYGFAVSRFSSDPRSLLRLVVRIPRERVVDLGEADLIAFARTLGPPLDAGKFRQVRVCQVVAEQDGLRFRAADFLADVAARWGPLRAPTVALAAPEPAASPPAPKVKPVLPAEPLFEFEQELRSVDDPQATLQRLHDSTTVLHQLLEGRGFRVTPNELVAGTHYVLTAERKSGFPRRVAAKLQANFTRFDAEQAIREARANDWDQLYVLAMVADAEAATLVATSKVKVLRPDEVGSLVP